MASPKEVMQSAFKKPAQTTPAINQLISRVFNTRNLAHFAHWNTGSFAAHSALGELYDGIVDEVDNIVETYQGEFGLLENLCSEKAELCCDIIDTIRADAYFLKENRDKIANGSKTIENMLDNLTGMYNKVIYKLTNLK